MEMHVARFTLSLAVLLTIAFFVAVAILQPGIFGTLALYILAAAIFLIGTGFAFAIKFRANEGIHQRLHSQGGDPEQL